MKYRQMELHDIAEVAELYRQLAYFLKNETGDEYFDFNTLSGTEIEKQLTESLARQGSVTFLAQENSTVVAFISGEVKDCFLPFSSIKKTGYISGAYVLPHYRNKGIMKSLERLLVEHFSKQGLGFVELNVISNNNLGKRSWEALGYRTFREQMRKKIL